MESIARVGLKKPITVSSRTGSRDHELVCGEGRIGAFTALKAKEIPAIVTKLSTEQCILLSLVENIARRRHSPLELVSDISRLSKRYDVDEISSKLGVLPIYVKAVSLLLKNGEEHLIKTLERKAITPQLALEVARAETPDMQQALLHADGNHTVAQIAKIRKLMGERRRRQVKPPEQEITPAALVRVYRQETARQALVARKADLVHMRLVLLDGHLRRAILMDRGDTEVKCLLADDDEAFTYNKRINRLAAVQEHFLIVRAIDRGISEAKLAKTLGVEINYVKRRKVFSKASLPTPSIC